MNIILIGSSLMNFLQQIHFKAVLKNPLPYARNFIPKHLFLIYFYVSYH